MAAAHHRRSPAFFWQAVFILLPVLGLSAYGIYSLQQDRFLARQEARDAGQLLADRLAAADSAVDYHQLGWYRHVSNLLYNVRGAALGQFSRPEDPVATSNAWAVIHEWQTANPEIDLLTLPIADGPGGAENEGEILTPTPPQWLAELSPQQKTLWAAVEGATSQNQDARTGQSSFDDFVASKPPNGARAGAEYLLALAKMRQLSDRAADLFTNLTDEPPGALTDAGLPVAQLAWLQILRATPEGTGVTDKCLASAGRAITQQPSLISPRLIAEVERVARGSTSETAAKLLNDWWEANEKKRVVLVDLMRNPPTNTWTAPHWVNSRVGTYLVVMNDFRPADPKAWPLGHLPEQSFLIIPRIVVEKVLKTTVAEDARHFPPYVAVEFEMGGKSIALSRNLAAEAIPRTLSPPSALLGQAAGSWFSDVHGDFRSLDPCPFTISVFLANADLLYARHTFRTRIFGLLILASAGAAVMGLFGAWRAFRYQQELNEQKSNFVSSVSHELRAPIASVRLMAENLERGKVSEPAKQGEYFRFIVQECRRLSSLIENVLDFSRIEQGRKQYEFEPTNLVALVETTVKLMEPYAAEKGVILKLETFNSRSSACQQHSTPNVELNLDGRAIQQAVVNLIDNAVKHSPKGETVTVGIETTLNPQPSTLNLFVSDHGPGIPSAEREKIFERFYRLGSELRRETQGVGIGLSVVKHIVEAHGGHVRVESEVGQGSRFTIELPLKQ